MREIYIVLGFFLFISYLEPDHYPVKWVRGNKRMSDKSTLPQPHQAIQTVIRFFRHLDENNYQALAALLHPQGVWHRQGAELRGEEEVISALAKRSPTRRIVHLLTNLVGDMLEDGVAGVTGYMLVVKHEAGAELTGPAPLEGIESIRIIRARVRDTEHGWRVERMASDPPLFTKTS